jgi:hypothetical protein
VEVFEQNQEMNSGWSGAQILEHQALGIYWQWDALGNLGCRLKPEDDDQEVKPR